MAELYTRIQEDLKAALKARSELELSALRMLKSDIQYEATKTGATELPDDVVQNIVKRAIKKRKEAAEQFSGAGRREQADKENQEIEILEKYLPEQVSEEAILQELDRVIAEVKPGGPGDLGKVMGKVMAAFKGRNIDGAMVKNLAQKKIQG